MNVLHVVPTFYPATYWGGPIFSLYGLCNGLARLPDCNMRVLTTDAAGPSFNDRLRITQSPAYYDAGYEVYFTRRRWGRDVSPGLLGRLGGMVRWADIVHLTGAYSFPVIPTLSACRLFRKPLVWSPRGALQRWAGSSRPLAKLMWEQLCNAFLLKHRSTLHVTSEGEGRESAVRMPGVRIVCIPNGTDLPELPPRREWKRHGQLRVLYIGRLDPKKGIENLLAGLAELPEVNLRLMICGRGDGEYDKKLYRMVEELGLGERVQFRGHVEGEEKTRAFLEADFSIVPSHTENFGMVVAEALAHGLPVVASRGTPWSELESKGCGLWVDNSPGSLATAIVSMSNRNLQDMGSRGREWMEAEFSWDSIAKKMMSLYAEMISDGKGRR